MGSRQIPGDKVSVSLTTPDYAMPMAVSHVFVLSICRMLGFGLGSLGGTCLGIGLTLSLQFAVHFN